jgi:hypothetical protein
MQSLRYAAHGLEAERGADPEKSDQAIGIKGFPVNLETGDSRHEVFIDVRGPRGMRTGLAKAEGPAEVAVRRCLEALIAAVVDGAATGGPGAARHLDDPACRAARRRCPAHHRGEPLCDSACVGRRRTNQFIDDGEQSLTGGAGLRLRRRQ